MKIQYYFNICRQQVVFRKVSFYKLHLTKQQPAENEAKRSIEPLSSFFLIKIIYFPTTYFFLEILLSLFIVFLCSVIYECLRSSFRFI